MYSHAHIYMIFSMISLPKFILSILFIPSCCILITVLSYIIFSVGQ